MATARSIKTRSSATTATDYRATAVPAFAKTKKVLFPLPRLVKLKEPRAVVMVRSDALAEKIRLVKVVPWGAEIVKVESGPLVPEIWENPFAAVNEVPPAEKLRREVPLFPTVPVMVLPVPALKKIC